MKIHILSDLHIEFAAFDPLSYEADVIVLAGDIWFGSQGIAWARKAWPDKELVFVPGNHEYYRSEIRIANEQMELSGKALGVHVLNRKKCIINGVRFLGATLWTDFGLFGEDQRNLAYEKAVASLRDFHVIDYGKKVLTPQDTVKFNTEDTDWLEANLIHDIFDGPTVVVTHHLPSTSSVAERYRQQLLSACFASNFDHLLGHSKLWIHGHTHDSFDYVLNSTRVICNPRGYCRAGKSPENQNFNPGLVVEI